MNKLSIIQNNHAIEFGFGKVKYLYGNNYEMKHFLSRTLKKHFFGVDQTEYDREKDCLTEIKIDDKPLDTKKWKMYEISDNYDVDTELKLGSKAILLKYIELSLVNIEYDETVQTINILLNDLCKILEEKINQLDSKFDFLVEFPELTTKFLVKNMNLGMMEEGYKINGYNLTIEELLWVQVKMAIFIATSNDLFNYIFLIDTPILYERIKTLIECHELPNLHFLVAINEPLDTDVDNVISFESKSLDFANEVDLYNDILLELEVTLTLDELKEKLHNYICKEEDPVLKHVVKLL
ncbi:MAG: CRISPR-associated protein Csn2-St [Acholeplasma sp.]|nr:CRISPR-associated protein Csn2-St [Acholeplasma sp.]